MGLGMADLVVEIGQAFLIDTPPNGEHLYIAIALIGDGRYLFVNVTTRRASSETTCILDPRTPGLPSFINRESVVAYQYARAWSPEELSRVIKPGSRVPKCIFSDEIVSRIQSSGLISKRLSNQFKTALKIFLNQK